jgi:hypothetical protein
MLASTFVLRLKLRLGSIVSCLTWRGVAAPGAEDPPHMPSKA